jgi:hypothetical protein
MGALGSTREVLYAPAYINIEHGFGGVIFTRAVKIYITSPIYPWGSIPLNETLPHPPIPGGLYGGLHGVFTPPPRGSRKGGYLPPMS